MDGQSGGPYKRKREDPSSTGQRLSYAVGCRVGTTANGAGGALMRSFYPESFPSPPACPAISVLPQCSVGPTPTRNRTQPAPGASSNLRDGPRGLHGLKYAQIARARLVVTTRWHLAVAVFAGTDFIQASAWRLRSTPGLELDRRPEVCVTSLMPLSTRPLVGARYGRQRRTSKPTRSGKSRKVAFPVRPAASVTAEAHDLDIGVEAGAQDAAEGR